MSIKGIGWIVAFSLLGLGFVIGLDMGLTGLAGFVTGVWFTSAWAYVLRGKS